MSKSIWIRRANAEDLPVLINLLNILFSIEADFTPNPQKQYRGLQLMLEGEQCCILVAEIEGKIAGMVTAQLVVSTAEGAYSGWIEDMVIFPEYRQQGIGSRLLAAIETWCYQNGAVRVQLLADRENRPALEFYSKNGWQGTQLITLRKLFSQ